MEAGSYCMKWIRVGKHARLCHHSSSTNDWNYQTTFTGFVKDSSPMFKTLLARPVAYYACAHYVNDI